MPTWKEKLASVKQSERFQSILDSVARRYKQTTVYPPRDKLFEALELTPYESVKCVILGQDPYHQPNQANGLAFSVSANVSIPPSLNNIFKERRDDLGLPMPNHGDLRKWAKEGVLLLNTTLSVEHGKPGSHKKLGWSWVTDAIIEALNDHPQPIVFLLWGNHAASKRPLIDESRHCVIAASHPSPLAARHSFFGSQPFSRANAFLIAQGRDPIDFSLENSS